jgi:hypothetical protein
MSGDIPDLNVEFEELRGLVQGYELKWREATREWLIAVYDLVLEIMKSERLQAQLAVAYRRAFSPHPRTFVALRVMKLSILGTSVPVTTAHRWAQAIDFGLHAGWSKAEFQTKLRDHGVDGIMKLRLESRPVRGAKPSPAVTPVSVELVEEQTAKIPELKESTTYLFLVSRTGTRVGITAVIEPTPALLLEIERAQLLQKHAPQPAGKRAQNKAEPVAGANRPAA